MALFSKGRPKKKEVVTTATKKASSTWNDAALMDLLKQQEEELRRDMLEAARHGRLFTFTECADPQLDPILDSLTIDVNFNPASERMYLYIGWTGHKGRVRKLVWNIERKHWQMDMESVLDDAIEEAVEKMKADRDEA